MNPRAHPAAAEALPEPRPRGRAQAACGGRPATVVAGNIAALAVVRALGEAGIRVTVLHYGARDLAHVSRRAVASAEIPPPHRDDEGFLAALLLRAPPGRGLLVPASDEAVVSVARHRGVLEAAYVVACPPWRVSRNFIEKRRTYAIAARAGVPVPQTLGASSPDEARASAERIGFPLLVKPSQSHLFFDRFRRRLTRVDSMEELASRVLEARAAGLDVVLQEMIPGDDAQVVNYNCYRAGAGHGVEFTARQLRKSPPRFGPPRVVVSERVDEVIEPGRATVAALGVLGFSCSEFKRDPRDGRYKLLDVNGRHNHSGLLAVRCGINFPLIQYRHLIEGEEPRPRAFTVGLYWMDLCDDAAQSLRHPLELVRPGRALRPYLRRHCDAVLDGADLLPFLSRCWGRARRGFRRAS